MLAERTDTESTTARRVCTYCGDTSDVVSRTRYVGGQGYSWSDECRDVVACWARRDVQAAMA